MHVQTSFQPGQARQETVMIAIILKMAVQLASSYHTKGCFLVLADQHLPHQHKTSVVFCSPI